MEGIYIYIYIYIYISFICNFLKKTKSIRSMATETLDSESANEYIYKVIRRTRPNHAENGI